MAARADPGAVLVPRALFLDPIRDAAFGPRRRHARMAGMLAGIILLSFADLYMTLTHLRGLGMAEANPLARGIISYNSSAALVLWKVATVGLAVGILVYARKKATAELAALLCCGVLCWLTVRWAHYNERISELTSELNYYMPGDDPAWVAITGE